MSTTTWVLVEKAIGKIHRIKTKTHILGTQFETIGTHFVRAYTESTITINETEASKMVYAWPNDVITIKGRTYIIKRKN